MVTRLLNFPCRVNAKFATALDLFPGYPSGMSTSPVRFWKVAVVVDILRTIPGSWFTHEL